MNLIRLRFRQNPNLGAYRLKDGKLTPLTQPVKWVPNPEYHKPSLIQLDATGPAMTPFPIRKG